MVNIVNLNVYFAEVKTKKLEEENNSSEQPLCKDQILELEFLTEPLNRAE